MTTSDTIAQVLLRDGESHIDMTGAAGLREVYPAGSAYFLSESISDVPSARPIYTFTEPSSP